MHMLISQIKVWHFRTTIACATHLFTLDFCVVQMQMPDGWVDGADRYPVYSVSPSSTLSYTMQKLIASQLHASQALPMYDTDWSFVIL